MTLGQYPLVGLKDARDKGAIAKELADQGVDPIDHRNDELTSRLKHQFSKVVSSFIELHAKPHTKNWRDTKHLLEQPLNPDWGSKDIQVIDRAAIHKLLDRIFEEKSASHAREIRKHLSIMFNWCADRGICQFNPMAGMTRRDLKYSPRERVLELDEINATWQVCKEIGYPFGPMVQLLILSGQRRSEIANLKHSWITDDFIEIPATEYKSGKFLPKTYSSLTLCCKVSFLEFDNIKCVSLYD